MKHVSVRVSSTFSGSFLLFSITGNLSCICNSRTWFRSINAFTDASVCSNVSLRRVDASFAWILFSNFANSSFNLVMIKSDALHPSQPENVSNAVSSSRLLVSQIKSMSLISCTSSQNIFRSLKLSWRAFTAGSLMRLLSRDVETVSSDERFS